MIPEVIDAIVALAQRLGVRSIKDLPGCWELQVDERWWFAFNGHKDERTAKQYTVPPYSCVVEYNGWPAGRFDLHGGVLAAGECANEDTLIDALRARSKKEGET